MNNFKKNIFEKCNAFDVIQYEKLDLNRLAVYAIWHLNENDIAITIENITVALFLMFPEKFSLVGFLEYPDSNRVNRALLQLRPKYRNWATGDVRRGFNLTETGRIELEKIIKMLESPQLQLKTPKGSRPRTRELDVEMGKILKSSAFEKYDQKKYEEITKLEVYEFLEATPYTPPNILNKYLVKIKNEAKESRHPDCEILIEFLNWVKKRFPDLFLKNKR